MRKKILFVIESLSCGGAEKSLTTLLNLLDYEKYDVDLQLFVYGGEFQELLPKEVNVLPQLTFFKFCQGTLMDSLKYIKDFKTIGMLSARLKYSVNLRFGHHTHPEKAVIMWKSVKKSFKRFRKHYDIAIAYAQGVPTFYVADCVQAGKKIAWINATYKPTGKYLDYITRYYTKFDYINCVSDVTKQQFEEIFPYIKNKADVIFDISDSTFITKMSGMASDVEAVFSDDVKYNLLTVGRLCMSKGYDIALEAAKILKERNISYCWYVIGKGELESKIRRKIMEYHLEDMFILLGTRANPYPFFKKSDIYVQTSKFEGYGITIAEARMLNKPIVATAFDAVYTQIVNEKNGLVVDMTAEAVADGIQRMIEDNDLRNYIISNLKQEKKGNTEEINKFYELIG
jgi:glycosyltransferase involved in cell wall biosynthesis